ARKGIAARGADARQEGLRGAGGRVVPGRVEGNGVRPAVPEPGWRAGPRVPDEVLEAAPARAARLVSAAVDGADVQNLGRGGPGGMSGICAVLRKEDTGRTAGTLEAVGRGLALVDAERLAQKMVPGAGVAVSAVFDGQQVYSNEWVLVGCDAEIYNEAELQ